MYQVETIKQILLEMRIRQWTKNLFVYAAILFNGDLFNFNYFITVSMIFISFNLTASGIYFINDIVDIERDKLNPKKCQRPIASEAISKSLGSFCACTLIIFGLFISYVINNTCFFLMLSYVILNLIYSTWQTKM